MFKKVISFFIISGMIISCGICVLADEETEETELIVTEENIEAEEDVPEETAEEIIIETVDEEPAEESYIEEEEISEVLPEGTVHITTLEEMTASEYGDHVHRTECDEPGENCVFGIAEGTFADASTDEIIDLINQYRWEACVNGYPDPRNPSRNLTQNDYMPLVWSRSLEETAMIRAAEAYFTRSHSTLDLYYFNMHSFEYKPMAENLSFGRSDLISALESWYGEKDAYLNGNTAAAGHYMNMIAPGYNMIGMAGFNNTVSAEFYKRCNTDPNYGDIYFPDADYYPDGSKVDVTSFDSQLLEIDLERISSVNITYDGDDGMIFVGDSYSLIPMATLTKGPNNIIRYKIHVLPDSWSSDDPSVLSIDEDGNIQALSEGTAEISCILAGVSFTRTVYVNPVKTPGWNTINGSLYYLNDDLSFYTGWLVQGDKTYYLGTDGAMVTGEKKIGGFYFIFNDDGSLQTGFNERNGTMRYVYSDGTYAAGWQEINGSTYYFTSAGAMATGRRVISGYGTFFFYEDGKMATCYWYTDPSSGKRSYFGEDGKLVSLSGWVCIEGVWYKDGEITPGWQTINLKKYYLDDNGKAYTGIQTIDGVKYCFNDDGSGYTGWKKIGTSWYYFVNAEFKTGWLYLDDDRYYLDDKGVMQTSWRKIDDKWFYFDQDGKCLTGYQIINGSLYHINVYYGMTTGWLSDGEDRYYFQENGKAATGFTKINDKLYYFNDEGKQQTGLFEVDGDLYYSNSYGFWTGWLTLDGSRYYFAEDDGKAVTGWQKLYDNWYYFGSDHKAQKGWKKISGKWYYFDEVYGQMLTGKIRVDGKYYYMNSSGSMATGWKKVGSSWYYLGSNGVMAEGWKKISGKWYYFRPGSGNMVVGVNTIDNKRYYFDNNGCMMTGWIECYGSWFHTDNSGAFQTGWQKIETKWYYFNSSGLMLTGTQIIDGKTYTFNSSGTWIK